MPKATRRSPTPPVSLRGFARSLGVALSAVQRAISDGRLPSAKRVRGVWTLPKPDQARREWEAHTRPRVAAKGGPTPPPADHAPEANGKAAGTLSPLAEATAREREIRAKTLELEYARKAGHLIDVDAVKRDAFEVARTVRDTLLILPDRLAAELAAETDPARVHARLDAEIRQALEALASG